jgi:transmembrane sensor
MDNSTIDILISKKLSSEITDHELLDLNEWVNQNDENKSYFATYQTMWTKLDIKDDTIDLDKQYERFTQLRVSSKTPYYKYTSIAASLLLVFSYFIFFATGNSFTTESMRQEIAMNDGSIVKLNRFTKMEYDFTEESRHITLTGEGFFKVKKDGRPFIIKTADAEVSVLGTEFTVSTKNNITTVSVLEGKVSLRSIEDTTKSIILTKGMKSNSTTFVNNDSNYTSSITWLENRIEFNNVTLIDICKRLEKEFKLEIEIRNKTLENKRLSATLADENIKEILESIAELIGAKLSKENNTYIIL